MKPRRWACRRSQPQILLRVLAAAVKPGRKGCLSEDGSRHCPLLEVNRRYDIAVPQIRDRITVICAINSHLLAVSTSVIEEEMLRFRWPLILPLRVLRVKTFVSKRASHIRLCRRGTVMLGRRAIQPIYSDRNLKNASEKIASGTNGFGESGAR